MWSEAVILSLIVGPSTWALRYLPLRARLADVPPASRLSRFLAATGPAAIATLFVAAALPYFRTTETQILPGAAGVAAVLLVFALRASVAMATLAGSLAFGLATFMLTG